MSLKLRKFARGDFVNILMGVEDAPEAKRRELWKERKGDQMKEISIGSNVATKKTYKNGWNQKEAKRKTEDVCFFSILVKPKDRTAGRLIHEVFPSIL